MPALLRALLLALLILPAAAEARPRHAEELLAEPWIAQEWRTIIAGKRFGRSDRWIPTLGAVGWPPATLRDESGTEWVVGRVCQAHNCPYNQVTIIVDRKGRRVFGMHEKSKERLLRFFGNPPPAIRAWLPRAAEQADRDS